MNRNTAALEWDRISQRARMKTVRHVRIELHLDKMLRLVAGRIARLPVHMHADRAEDRRGGRSGFGQQLEVNTMTVVQIYGDVGRTGLPAGRADADEDQQSPGLSHRASNRKPDLEADNYNGF